MNLIRRHYQLFKILPDEERGRTVVSTLTTSAIEEIFSPEQIKQYLMPSIDGIYRIRESVIGGRESVIGGCESQKNT